MMAMKAPSAVEDFAPLSPRRSSRRASLSKAPQQQGGMVEKVLAPLSPRRASRRASMSKAPSSRGLRSFMTRRSSLSIMDALELDGDDEEQEQPIEKTSSRPPVNRRASMGQQMSSRRLSMSNLFAGSSYEKVKSSCKDNSTLKSKSYHGKSFRRQSLSSKRDSLRSKSCHGKGINSLSTTESDTTECMTMTETSSEYEAEVLLDTLDKHIQELNDRKQDLETQIQDKLQLAKARYQGGSGGACTLVALRTVTKKKALRAHTVGTRFQLIDLKKRVTKELEAAQNKSSSGKGEVVHLDLDLSFVQSSMLDTLRKLSTQEPCPNPSDEFLLNQLRRLVEQGEGSESNQ